nr:C10 family peptidase [Bacteroides intestinalis]
MRKLLLLSWLLLCSLMVWAAQRSSEDALSIARSFFMQSNSIATRNAADVQLVAVSSDLLNSTSTRSATNGNAFYIYNNAHSAYVIVSGDDCMKPVLGYSDNGSFITENLPVNILSWLEYYNAVYENIKNGKKVFAEPKLLIRKSFPASISPLLGEINWNQDTPYNNACPMIQGQRSVTGCVATAMAMILKYYEYPAKGTGHYFYTSNGVQYSFDYGNTTFDWNNMLPRYSGTYTVEQADAVAQLMYACGVSVEMEYSPSSSGAYSFKVGQALIDYFGYDENLGYIYREYFTSEEWMNLIKKEISEGRPVLYNGASKDVGHEFVFDGYDTQDMVHVNWGWGGVNNGYFEVASLNPSSPGIGGGTDIGGGFIYQQGMITGFQPPVATSSYTSHFYLSKLEVSKNEVTKGENFDLTITEMYNMSTTFKNGQLGLIAEKDGKQSALWNISLGNVKPNFGTKGQTFSNITVPSTLTDGTYALYLATKDSRETAWSRVRGSYGSETQFILTISGNKCILASFGGDLNLKEDLDGSVESLHNLYSGRRGDFKMLLSNKSTTSDFYGLAGVLFITADEDAQLISLAGYTQLELRPGVENKEIKISGNLISNLTEASKGIPAGDYFICPGVQWGEYVYAIGDKLTPVTVNKASGTSTLIVENARLEAKQLQVGEKLKLLADLSLSGTGNVYDKTLMAAIFAVGQGSTSNLHYTNVFIEKGQTFNLEMEIDPQIEEGNYYINLYKPELLGGYGGDPLCRLYFSVGPATGIKDEITDKDEIIIYQQPVEDVLYIHTSNTAQMISIYNLSGQELIRQKESGDKKEYSIPVSGLSAGYYIVTLQSVNGNTYRSKFIKK